MTPYRETPEAAAFLATADSRETDPAIMQAIVFFATNTDEAEALWENGPDDIICSPTDMWERVTKNGLHDATDFCWGAAGSDWWAHMQGEGV